MAFLKVSIVALLFFIIVINTVSAQPSTFPTAQDAKRACIGPCPTKPGKKCCLANTANEANQTGDNCIRQYSPNSPYTCK